LRIGEDDDEGQIHKVTEKSHGYLFPTFGGTLATFGAAFTTLAAVTADE
jgi:hypothetical protein